MSYQFLRSLDWLSQANLNEELYAQYVLISKHFLRRPLTTHIITKALPLILLLCECWATWCLAAYEFSFNKEYDVESALLHSHVLLNVTQANKTLPTLAAQVYQNQETQAHRGRLRHVRYMKFP